MAMEDQVMVIFAGTNRYLDKVPVDKVKDWEEQFVRFMHDVHAHVPDTIRDTGKLEPEIEEALKGAIGEFNQAFVA
jgi:F-type H+-transporting ATPase subunit alpha